MRLDESGIARHEYNKRVIHRKFMDNMNNFNVNNRNHLTDYDSEVHRIALSIKQLLICFVILIIGYVLCVLSLIFEHCFNSVIIFVILWELTNTPTR